jgi:RNA polymerase sigma factor (sigma-70 family)
MTAADPRVIALVGFMGAGKSAVGRAVAHRCGRRHVDTDDEVERRAGRRIADIFADDGEASFRALESATIIDLLTNQATDLVLSLGGGALTLPTTRAALRQHAVVVHLLVGYEQALERVGGDPGRPMLARPDLPQLYLARLPAYRDAASLEIDTGGRTLGQVTQAVMAAVRPSPWDDLARQAVDDPAAMERLLGEIRPRVLRLCGRFLPCHQDAEDACQDTLLAVSQGLARWDGRAAFSSWLYRVAANRSRSTYEVLRRRSLERPGPLMPAETADPRTTSVVAGTRLDLLEGLSRLSPEAAEAVALRDVLDLGYREIAELLAVPEGTVKSRIHDARRQLRRSLT